jgi:hypothetical protein|tara:strand:+ start:715 stop:1305 length:591 start_codon:yes stop_codon:yes gene_type:complete
MAISPTNLFEYYSVLSKKRRLDDREFRVRSKETMLSSQPVPVAPVVDQEDKFIEAQNFFGMGFREGMRQGQLGEEFNPNQIEDMFKFYFGTGLKRREQGGPVAKGQAYLVGESGPEIIKPVESGNVIPNQNIKGIVDNINQSVGMDRGKTRTLIQPQVTVETQVIPQPTPIPITRTVTVETMTKSKFNSTLARGIR